MIPTRESYLSVMEYRKQIESDIWRFFRNDPELARAHPVPHPRKPSKIIFYSGAMAGFFPLTTAAGKLGVKLFLQKIPDLGPRYEAIGAALKQLASPHFITLEYREGPKGGAVWGTEYTPYVKMECVEGVVLKDKVAELAARGDANGLAQLAEQWKRIAMMMERQQIAHGDIQAENLMVEPSGRIRLIDLDTMFVPALRPRQFRCVAFGIPAWQHPAKLTDEAHFDERLDRFPALAMYLCLLALADDPGLFNPQAVGENELLFTRQDIQSPGGSSVFRRLSQAPNPEVRRLADALARAALGPYDDLQSFSRVVDPDAEANEMLGTFKAAVSASDHRAAVAAWAPLLETFAPAQPFRAQYELACAHLEKLQRCADAALAEDDAALAEIWDEVPGFGRCPCPAAERLPGGETVGKRATVARERMRGIRAVQEAISVSDQQRLDTGWFPETGEGAIVAAWTDARYGLAASKTALSLVGPRVEQAQRRFAGLRDLESLLRADDDEPIAKAWGPLADFGPAQRHQTRAADAAGRMETLAAFLAQVRKDPNQDTELWAIWSRRSDMDRCRPAARPLAQFGGLVPAQRAALARKRVEALDELKQVFEARRGAPLDEPGERELLSAWRQREAALGTSSAAAPFRKRAEEAQKRLRAWELLRQGLEDNDDEPLAAAWQTGLLGEFAPALPFAAQCQESVERMRVITALDQRHAESPEDEAGFRRIAASGPDLSQCRAFVRPHPSLDGRSWRDRLQLAAKLLGIRATLDRALGGSPPAYDQAAEVWEDALCRRHPLFAGDLPRIQEALDLARFLKELRLGLRNSDPAMISAAWRDEFRAVVSAEELARIRSALEARFTGPNCLAGAEIALEGETLTVRWDWRGASGFCCVSAEDGHYPDAPATARPNAFQGGATGGLCTLPFSGNSPHVRIWAMFRFLDQFVLGREPLERRLASVEYSVARRFLGGRQLSLKSLSGPLELPELAVFISENPMWPGLQACQSIPPRRIEGEVLVELLLPATVNRERTLYVGLRPADRAVEGWLRLRPRSAEAVKIRL